MKRLISLLFVFVLLLCGCSADEEITPYDLALCDTDMSVMCEYISAFESESYKVENIAFDDAKLAEIIASLEENSDGLNSITLYSKNITDLQAQQFTDFAKALEIPVIFAFGDVSADVLADFDTAFSITTNYTHAGEMTAEMLEDMWDSGTIIDADENMLFAFASIKEEQLNDDMQAFYATLVDGIELYGVPMQHNGTISPDEVTDGDSLVVLNENNEALIVADKNAAEYIIQYTPYSDGVELITFTEGVENNLAGCDFVLNCFLDYKNYKLAADEIIENFNNRQYPLIELSFPYIEKTVYIPASIQD